MLYNNETSRSVIDDFTNNRIPILMGKPGTGKFNFLATAALMRHTKYFVSFCSLLTRPEDVTAKYSRPIDRNVVFERKTVMHDAIEYAEEHPNENPILIFDDILNTDGDTMTKVLSVAAKHAINDKPLPSNLKIAMTATIINGKTVNLTGLPKTDAEKFVIHEI